MRKHILVAALLVSGTACAEDAVNSPLPNPRTMVPPGSVQVIIAQETALGGDSAVFVVRLAANGVPLAAYQGTVTFAPQGIEIIGIRTPENGEGEFRIVNAEGAATGMLRFAGFATQAMSSTEAFRIVGRLKGGVAALKLEGSLDVVGEVGGTQILASSLLRSTGVFDATTNVQLAP